MKTDRRNFTLGGHGLAHSHLGAPQGFAPTRKYPLNDEEPLYLQRIKLGVSLRQWPTKPIKFKAFHYSKIIHYRKL